MTTNNGTNRTEKEHQQLLVTASGIAQRIGQANMGLGVHIAHIAMMPKQAAGDLLKVADKLETLRGDVLDLANAVIDWEQSAIRAGMEKGLVDASGRPIAK